MITNEQRARLLGVSKTDIAFGRVPPYDTDANAVAELRAFVRARGKENLFTRALDRQLTADTRGVSKFESLDATPAQQCAAFDIVFKDELEKL